jgi:hypothetical protein
MFKLADAETQGSAVDEQHPAGSIDADQAAGEIGGGAGSWSDGAAEGDRGSECRARSEPLGSRRFMGHQEDCCA